ncbi:hypothetical protein [Actinospica robiniae]|uniref:hypothetical protein n=1 Tax=Actinospica robiniae TaxID=304901 RepID=UPI000409B38B|nr:hypothetical protein [Actinospica robiniae]
MAGNADIEVDVEQLRRGLAALERSLQALRELSRPHRPGEYRGLDNVGVLGAVHENETVAMFDQRMRRLIATLEALVQEHLALLRHTMRTGGACVGRYQENEQALVDMFKQLGEH